jgi:hypothetical protein
MKASQHPDMVISCLVFLFMFDSPDERGGLRKFGSPWRTVAVDLQTFEKKKQTKLLMMHDVC